MRRSISLAEPNHCLAGEIGTWKFHHTSATALPKGTNLRFDLLCKGREIDWTLPSTALKKGTEVIYLLMPDGTAVEAEEEWLPGSYTPVYDFTLPKEVKGGKTLSIIIGGYKGSGKVEPDGEVGAQTFTQRRRLFHLYIDPKGKGYFDEPEVFHIDVKGNILEKIRILTPSFVNRNKRFDVTIRFEDAFGNLTSYAPEDTLVELTYEHLRENLNWKLFVPETGFIILPNLYFNDPGIYRIQLDNLNSGSRFYSSPIKCFEANESQLFWGLLHGESETIDFIEETESCVRQLRDDLSLNFFASSVFESEEQLTNDNWRNISQTISDFNEEERFTTFLGLQWTGKSPGEGIRQIIYAKDNRPMLSSSDSKSNQLKKIYKSHSPKDILSIPSFTMSKKFGFNFKDFSPEIERVVEIYNAWGSSECTKKEGNLFPINGKTKNATASFDEGSVRSALSKNKRFGFVAGGLDDRGVYYDFYDSDQVQYPPGLTAIIAPDLSRENLFNALWKRSCYATTGDRILLGFFLAEFPMGSEVDINDRPGLNYIRHINGYVSGTDTLTKIELIRNGKVIFTDESKDHSYTLAFDDQDEPEGVSLPGSEGGKFIYYYLRVTQANNQVAWSSPIWLDFPKAAKKK